MNDIYSFAEENNITISDFKSKTLKSFSIPDEIAVNEKLTNNRADLKTCLIHEIGHCMTGSFYNINSKFDIRSQHEYRADKWAIEKYLPFDELVSVIKHGITEVWEIAEHFELTEDFVRKALYIYEENFIELKKEEFCK